MAKNDGDIARGIEVERDLESGKPLAYESGKQMFMGLELVIAPGVLVPRPITERVGDAAVTVLARLAQDARADDLHVVDMCSGSGNLACGIASQVARCSVWSCDIVPLCSDVALENVRRLGLADRVRVRTGDLFSALAGEGLEGRVDLVTCAPPFISTGRLGKDRAYLLEHEPREAFDAGPYGLAIHQRVVAEAAPFLRGDGYLIFEVGEGQSKQVTRLLERSGSYHAIEVVEQDDRLDVVVSARRRPPV